MNDQQVLEGNNWVAVRELAFSNLEADSDFHRYIQKRLVRAPSLGQVFENQERLRNQLIDDGGQEQVRKFIQKELDRTIDRSTSLTRWDPLETSIVPQVAEVKVPWNFKKSHTYQTPFQIELERSQTQLLFSRYPDNTLRLFKPGSLLSDEPAGYSEEEVSVKVLVKRPSEEFLVTLKVTRHALDTPGAEDLLAQAAYAWRR